MGITPSQSEPRRVQPWVGIAVLIAVALLYCSSALMAPFWNGNDTWSNLLPVIHYRQSILEQGRLPLYTDLWYGGREQWANPLWNFLYFPATLVWLALPLDWGTRVVFLGHLLFALFTGRMLATLFLKGEIEKAAAAILFTSPILVALTAGHVEKVMSWGWILLGLYCVLNPGWSSARRGLGSGICLGILALTGSNYYTFYAGILLVPLVVSFRDIKLFSFFSLGASLGLLHLPSVWHLVGQARTHAEVFIDIYSMDLWNGISSLAVGYSMPPSWEKWTPVGVLTLYLFGMILLQKIIKRVNGEKVTATPQEIALLISISILTMLASGLAYRLVSWFDLFRIPARALAFVALGIVLHVVMNIEELVRRTALSEKTARLILLISAVQILAGAWIIRPQGSPFSPYETSVQQLADVLKADHAKSVWLSTRKLDDMYIDVGLTRNHISLPNVYYGDMGQAIPIQGPYCGYSFDHILAPAPVDGAAIELYPSVEWSHTTGEIPVDRLLLLEEVRLGDELLNVYRVICR
jgi:hypothetical protein